MSQSKWNKGHYGSLRRRITSTKKTTHMDPVTTVHQCFEVVIISVQKKIPICESWHDMNDEKFFFLNFTSFLLNVSHNWHQNKHFPFVCWYFQHLLHYPESTSHRPAVAVDTHSVRAPLLSVWYAQRGSFNLLIFLKTQTKCTVFITVLNSAVCRQKSFNNKSTLQFFVLL